MNSDSKRSYFLKLTLTLYKVTELFPKREPLKFLLREKADLILADLIIAFSGTKQKKEDNLKLFNSVLGNIKILDGFLKISQEQGWLNKLNFSVLEREYNKIEKEIRETLRDINVQQSHKSDLGAQFFNKNKGQLRSESEPMNWSNKEQLRNNRCKKILELLNQQESLQVKDVEKFYPQVSKRTIRRDFEYLLNKGLVQRIGNGNMTLYKLR